MEGTDPRSWNQIQIETIVNSLAELPVKSDRLVSSIEDKLPSDVRSASMREVTDGNSVVG